MSAHDWLFGVSLLSLLDGWLDLVLLHISVLILSAILYERQ